MITRLAIYAAAVIIIMFLALRYAGIKGLEKDYEKDYKALERAVRHWKPTPRNYKKIRNMIISIRKYGCRDKERIDVLTAEFHRKYKVYNY